MQQKYLLYTVILLSILFNLILISLSFGSVYISFTEILEIFATAIKQNMDSYSDNYQIIMNLRFPRVILAVLGGASLSVAGLLLQIFFRNPLVGPYILGISSGSNLIIAIILLTNISFNFVQVISPGLILFSSFIGAAIVTLIIIYISKFIQNIITLVIIGLMISYFTYSLSGIMISWAESEQIKNFFYWSMGSLSGIAWDQMYLLYYTLIPTLFFTLLIFKPLNALLLGEEYAMNLGVSIKKWRWIIILTSSILTAIVTAFSGPIAFIGLAVPHINRLIFKTSDNKILIISTMISGAILLLLSDLIARTVLSPLEIPLNSVTSFIGAPIVIYFLLTKKGRL